MSKRKCNEGRWNLWLIWKEEIWKLQVEEVSHHCRHGELAVGDAAPTIVIERDYKVDHGKWSDFTEFVWICFIFICKVHKKATQCISRCSYSSCHWAGSMISLKAFSLFITHFDVLSSRSFTRLAIISPLITVSGIEPKSAIKCLYQADQIVDLVNVLPW